MLELLLLSWIFFVSEPDKWSKFKVYVAWSSELEKAIHVTVPSAGRFEFLPIQ